MKQNEGYPEYQSKDKLNIRFQKYMTLRQVYQETLKSNIDNFFSKHHQQDYSQIIFVFQVSNKNQTWNLRKTFQDLHNFQHSIRKKYKEIPKFPLSKDDEDKLQSKLLTSFIEFLRAFIKTVSEVALKDPLFTNFINLFPEKIGHGVIYGEFPFYKRSGGRYNETSCLKQCYHALFPCSRSWRQRYFTVTDVGIFYSEENKSFEIKDLLLYCFKFTIYYGIVRTGRQLSIVLQSSTRRLKLEASEFHVLILFIVAIKEALANSPFADEKKFKNEKFGSFAPLRENCWTNFYIDGKGYFQDLFNQLKKAQKTVYITGWMITPYFMLKRPNQLLSREYRFDGILEELAKRNVKIYIVLYQEPKIAINNDSQFVKRYLEEIGGNNIKVMRHPNYIFIPFLWSHHQKIVLIDQKVAFLGGLDICYGRWDTQKHYLTNPGKQLYWEGADFCNLRIRDIYKPRDYMMSNLNFSQPKMPWHDVAIQIKGSSVNDIARHFTSYWNFVNFQTKITDDRQLLNLAGLRTQNHISKFVYIKNFLKKLTFRRKKTKIEPMIQMTTVPISNIQGQSQNARKSGGDVKKYGKKDRQLSPDLPVPPRLNGQMQVRKRSITNRQRDSLDSNRSLRDSSRSSIRRKSSVQEEYYEKIIKQEETTTKNIENFFKSPLKLLKLKRERQDQDQKLIISSENDKADNGKHTHIVLRSSSTWSLGLSETQYSIHDAYLHIIRHSKRFIYIQNQFFIARENLVIEALGQRILKAFKQKQQFKVIVFIPLLPGFQGDVRESKSAVMRIQLLLEYQTICRSNNSLYSLLLDGGMKKEDIENYIKFYSLRQHGIIDNTPVTQILYIHSKLIIVDDQKMIIGSANINDRSLLGDRDSEIAVFIEQHQKFTVDNQKESSFRDIKSFRKSLLEEHFGIRNAQVQNFENEVVWKQLKSLAKRNTQIYRYVFGCYPDDKMKKFQDIEKIEYSTIQERSSRYKKEKENICGHAVELPLHFLEEENLQIQVTEKQYVLPDFFFT